MGPTECLANIPSSEKSRLDYMTSAEFAAGKSFRTRDL